MTNEAADPIEKFWLVWSPSGSSPTRKHRSRSLAEAEAMRLSRGAPGRNFFVLKAVTGFVSVLTPPLTIPLFRGSDVTLAPRDDVPF